MGALGLEGVQEGKLRLLGCAGARARHWCDTVQKRTLSSIASTVGVHLGKRQHFWYLFVSFAS